MKAVTFAARSRFLPILLVVVLLIQSLPMLFAFAETPLIRNGSFEETDESGHVIGWNMVSSNAINGSVEHRKDGGKSGAYVFMKTVDMPVYIMSTE